MNKVLYTCLTAVTGLVLCGSAVAKEQKQQFEACLDAAYAELIAARSEAFLSPQFRLMCDPGRKFDGSVAADCKKQERTRSFTYEARPGFRIDEPRFKVSLQTNRTGFGDIDSDGRRARIDLECFAECGDKGHMALAGNLVGQLIYEPTVADSKAIAVTCLENAQD